MSVTPHPLHRSRSMLFAPAVRTDFIAKLPGRGADLVVIDCEDATPANAKGQGRENARTLAPTIANQGAGVIVRVNPPATEWFVDDVNEGLSEGLAAVIVPKIETVDDIHAVADTLDAAGHPRLGIVAGIETALGVADARHLLRHPRVVGGYFGAEDFIADMGGVRTATNQEVLYARSAVALAGRLGGVPVLDQVVTDFGNDERFQHETAEARAMGYSGKLCIHPNQVNLANTGFSPSQEEIERATALLAAYDAASEAGLSAIAFDGQMVDEPLAMQARRVLDLARELSDD